MVRSKLSMIVSVLSLLVAVGSIFMLFSVRKAGSTGNARLSATSYSADDPAVSEPPLAIDPTMVDYRQTAKIAVDLKNVSALAVDADDRIYVAGDMSLCRFSPQGKLEKRIPLSYPPTCVTVGNRQHFQPGRIYVGFADHVEVYEADGAKAAIWQGLGEDARFTSISSCEQYIFIADAGQNVIQRFDWTGKLLESFGESSPGHFTRRSRGSTSPLIWRWDWTIWSTRSIAGIIAWRVIISRAGWNVTGGRDRRPSRIFPARAARPIGAHGGRSLRDRRGSSVAGQGLLAVHVTRASCSTAWCADPKKPVRWSRIAADNQQRILVLDGQARCVRVFEAKKRPCGRRSRSLLPRGAPCASNQAEPGKLFRVARPCELRRLETRPLPFQRTVRSQAAVERRKPGRPPRDQGG